MSFQAGRRAPRGRRYRRWLAALLPLVLILGTLGRGHLFQTMGLAIACEHPDQIQAGHDDSDESPEDASHAHKGCPTNCPRCPCGQMPVVPPVYIPVLVALLDFQELPDSMIPSHPGQSHAHRLERPPRHLGA